jgi:hypothetical protein
MALGKSRDPRKETFWRRMVRRQVGSGLSVRAWCENHALREATFYWWRAELARRDVEQPPFIPVRVTPGVPAGTEPRLDIVLTNGRRIQVSGRVDRAILADVVSILEQLGC